MATNAELLAQAQVMLGKYIEAESTVLTGQSYSIKDRTLTRANLMEIREGRKEWQSEVARLSNADPAGTSGSSSIRVKRVIPRD